MINVIYFVSICEQISFLSWIQRTEYIKTFVAHVEGGGGGGGGGGGDSMPSHCLQVSAVSEGEKRVQGIRCK